MNKKCLNCGSFLVVKNGFIRSNLQRYKYKNCSKKIISVENASKLHKKHK